MDVQKLKHVQRVRRAGRVRKKVRGTAECPRLTVFRSSLHIYAQLIDDETGTTLVSASSMSKTIKATTTYGGNKVAATVVGKALAEAAKAKGITKVSFDRGFYRYHGRIKALADAAREGGLNF